MTITRPQQRAALVPSKAGHPRMARRLPLAAYRVQLHGGFRFADAAALVPYWHALGITHLYTSPLFAARPGSLHGYDVTDYGQINPEIGSEHEFQHLIQTLREHGMGLLIDVVPNHMGIDASNRWWQDVLEHGPSSPYAMYFDIDWLPPKEDLANRVLLPVLGEQCGKVLEQGALKLAYHDGGFRVSYHERTFPITPSSWTRLLEPTLERVRGAMAADAPAVVELESILTAIRHLLAWTDTDPQRVRERQRETEVIRHRLRALVTSTSAVRETLDRVLEEFNGQPGSPRSFDQLEALLAEQPYRLCYWRVAADEINYRRFFETNELAAVREEEPDVFEAVHAVVWRLIKSGQVDGLRIDHPDGLYDPEQYFRMVQARYAQLRREPPADPSRPCYLVIEKILSPDERLRPQWPVHGTTGYDALALINGLFVDPEAEPMFLELYARLTGMTAPYKDVVYESKKLILQVLMSGELRVLARRLDRISEQHRWSRDFTFASLQEGLREVIACFPVYRTYVRAGQPVDDVDRRYILAAVASAKRRNPSTSATLFDFIASVLLREHPEGLTDAQRAERGEFTARFQQLTGPVMAKGVEDTAFYRYYPLASLNEVGGDPGRFGPRIEIAHRGFEERAAHWTASLNATSTHDTKRSEDVRARINVLSEIPQEWERAVRRWQSVNRLKKRVRDDAEIPDRHEEYLFYQTLVGIWPIRPLDDAAHDELVQRVEQYMEKALREAKLHTSWINPDEEYEGAVRQFVRRVLTRAEPNLFLHEFERFHGRVAHAGMLNALSQTLLKLTVPGVPDLYQGTELWDFSLVDPDNRRPVDFARYRRVVDALSQPHANLLPPLLLRDLLGSWADGRIKAFLITKALACRRAHEAVFLTGSYLPLDVAGPRHSHVVAFARRHAADWIVAAVPRWMTRLVTEGDWALGRKVWGDAAVVLPPEAPDRWRHVLTGARLETSMAMKRKTLPLHAVMRDVPLVLLEPGV